MQDVSGTRSAAEARLRHELVSQINGRQATFLLSLLDVDPKTNKSALEILRRRPIEQTVTGLIKALRRVGEVAGADLGDVDVTVVPQRRLRELARDGMMRNATALRRRRPYEYQLATPTGTPTSTCTHTTRSNRCNWPKASGGDRCGIQATPTPTRSERVPA
jgi:hypothetical protein